MTKPEPYYKTIERISASRAFTIQQEKAQVAKRITELQQRYDELQKLELAELIDNGQGE